MKQAVNQFDNAGQVCLAGTRLIVERSMVDAFLERFLQAAAAIRQGDPREETTDIGPLITREHFERVDGFVQRAKADGATVLLGGGPNEDLGGLYYRPTLFGDVPEGAEVLRKEVFGPVLTLQTFEDEDEAIALANETDYGLAAILYTGDRERAERVSARVVAGTVWVNSFFVRDLRAPFGGAKSSGVGREGGVYSFDFYADVKNVCSAPWEELGHGMGEIVGAALVAHVPTIMLPEEVRLEINEGKEITLVPGLHRIKAECLDRLQPDAVIVFDTHWESTFEHIVTAHERRQGKFTSHELPRGMKGSDPTTCPGDPELAKLIEGAGGGRTTAGSWRTTTRISRSSTDRQHLDVPRRPEHGVASEWR